MRRADPARGNPEPRELRQPFGWSLLLLRCPPATSRVGSADLFQFRTADDVPYAIVQLRPHREPPPRTTSGQAAPKLPQMRRSTGLQRAGLRVEITVPPQPPSARLHF